MPSNPQLTTISTIKDRDAHVDHIDYQEIPKDGGTKVQADKFGSVAKVDPKEIALVRKLDTYLMVRQKLSNMNPNPRHNQ